MFRRRKRDPSLPENPPVPAPPVSSTAKEQASGDRRDRWRFEQGDEIAPGRQALTLLGGGTDYEAYLAWDDVLHSTVVVKILRPHLVQQRRHLEHLRREVRILARLAHPVIVRSFGAVTGGSKPHVVLEHLEGPRLSSLIRRYGALPLEQLLPLGLRICSALHYLGTQRVVHLDIKPANIVMSTIPRLIDFSLARTWKSAEVLPRRVGTRKYMAPEQCLPGERGAIATSADVWGLGVSMYQAITGDLPFEFTAPNDERDPLLRYPQLTEAAKALPDSVPQRVREPVMACLEPDPSKRPPAAQVSAALEELVALLPTARPLGRRRPRLR
jgi:serine/threonine protein kinase